MQLRAPYLRHPDLAIALTAILLSGCAAPGAVYPSLAVRDAERVQGSFQTEPGPVSPAMAAPLSADVTERLTQLQAAAASAHRRFLDAAPGATRLVNAAAGASIASDSWSSAQVALAGLDSARSQAAVPLGDLDLMHAEASLSLSQSGAIGQARELVASMIAQQDTILSALRGKLAS
jgi:hypothetical protein